jgi:hypothetical protein
LRRRGIFVVEIATSISMMRGRVATRVSSPRRIRAPQTISQTPTKGAMTAGAGIPILTKRPTPQLLWKEKLLDAFGEKDRTHHETDEGYGRGCICGEKSLQQHGRILATGNLTVLAEAAR